MIDELEDKIKRELLEKLMGEMDDSVGARFKKPEVVAEVTSFGDEDPAVSDDDEDDQLSPDILGEHESPEDKLKRRIEAMRKKA